MPHFAVDAPTEPVFPRKSLPHEVFGVLAFFALCGVMLARMWEDRGGASVWAMGLAALGGYVAADFTSGLVHWLFDTWGSPRTPVVGATFITPFRIHHVDPKDITRHGFIATNGHNCLVSVPVMAGSLLLPHTAWASAALAFLLALCLGVFATNQFHKWAHEDTVHPVVGWLQRYGLVLSREHHDLHHAPPYSRHYCITTGWLNRPLEVLGFFRGLERLITAVTGARPRVDDLTTTGAATTEA
jgi:hypothetical protein